MAENGAELSESSEIQTREADLDDAKLTQLIISTITNLAIPQTEKIGELLEALDDTRPNALIKEDGEKIAPNLKKLLEITAKSVNGEAVPVIRRDTGMINRSFFKISEDVNQSDVKPVIRTLDITEAPEMIRSTIENGPIQRLGGLIGYTELAMVRNPSQNDQYQKIADLSEWLNQIFKAVDDSVNRKNHGEKIKIDSLKGQETLYIKPTTPILRRS